MGTSWINVFVGIWLIISPFAMGFSRYPQGLINNIAVGIALVILTFASARFGLLKALIVVIGAWMYASSLTLDVPLARYLWNNLILAAVVIVANVASEAPWQDDYSPKKG